MRVALHCCRTSAEGLARSEHCRAVCLMLTKQAVSHFSCGVCMHGQIDPIKCSSPTLELGRCVQAGYAVIFLHRRHSIQPFTKGLPSGQILDFMTSVLEPDEGAPGC